MTSRRSFLRQMLLCCTGAAILPGAITYTRTWKVAESGLLVTQYDWAGIYTGAMMRRRIRAEYRRYVSAVCMSAGCPIGVSESTIKEVAVEDGKGWLYDPA